MMSTTCGTSMVCRTSPGGRGPAEAAGQAPGDNWNAGSHPVMRSGSQRSRVNLENERVDVRDLRRCTEAFRMCGSAYGSLQRHCRSHRLASYQPTTWHRQPLWGLYCSKRCTAPPNLSVMRATASCSHCPQLLASKSWSMVEGLYCSMLDRQGLALHALLVWCVRTACLSCGLLSASTDASCEPRASLVSVSPAIPRHASMVFAGTTASSVPALTQSFMI